MVECRDSRRDGFVGVMKSAMQQRLGHLPDEVAQVLSSHKIPQHLIKEALELARQSGGFTIFSVVDALTQLTQKVTYAGDRTELDAKIGKLMSLAL